MDNFTFLSDPWFWASVGIVVAVAMRRILWPGVKVMAMVAAWLWYTLEYIFNLWWEWDAPSKGAHYVVDYPISQNEAIRLFPNTTAPPPKDVSHIQWHDAPPDGSFEIMGEKI